jgi:hypothetical protein
MAPDTALSENKAIQLSVGLPHAPSIRINIHLTIHSTSILLFLTTSATDAPSAGCPLGSFVYAMPHVTPPLPRNQYTIMLT